MIDLRSDTVTRPTTAMRQAMAGAEVGDDGYRDDPTVIALEQKAARLLEKEDALFVPSGTMGNLCAVLAQAERSAEVVVEATAHIHRMELGGLAVLGGVPSRAIPGIRGAIPIADLEQAFRPSAYAGASRPALLCLETSHNAEGGAVLPLSYLAAAHALAAEHGVAVHIDGARVFNAAVALGAPAAEIARHCDTLTFCLSKGLGAPAGSVLCGPTRLIERARVVRRMLGGAMRQSGVLAAAGLVALDTMIPRLAEDHRRAQRLATGLAALDPSLCDAGLVETNIVYVDVSRTGLPAAAWRQHLERHEVICRPWTVDRLRLVTHLDVSDPAIDVVISAFQDILGGDDRAAGR